jgi:hypothetical protein
MVETSNVTAGTLNPHHPKRTVSTTQIRDWLHEADDLGMPQTAMDCDAPDRTLPFVRLNIGDLYDRIIRKYAGQLEARRPVIEIPVVV